MRHSFKILLICFLAITIAGLSAYFGPREIYSTEQLRLLNAKDLNFLDQITIGKNSLKAKFWSDFIQNGSIALAFLTAFAFYFKKKNELQQAVLFTLTALSLNVAGINIAKNLFARPRPWMYLESFQERGVVVYTDMLSHYSGHTSTAFSMLAVVFILLFPFCKKTYRLLLAFLLLSIASICGWLRIEAGFHYFSDVVHGAFWGTFFTFVAARLVMGEKWFIQRNSGA